ncbi:MAG: glycoside hydrolase family 5 protein [Lachnospiraceae bacterium]|nr:glycoside hydrolase family 5 protein [Lachnospiraceae bacterium]
MNRMQKILLKSTHFILVIAMIITSISINYSFAESKRKPTLNRKKLELKVGSTYKLKVKNYKGKVRWKSNKKRVATVSKKGKVKAIKTGKATIIAFAGKTRIKCTVKVKKGTDSQNNNTNQNPNILPTVTPIPTPSNNSGENNSDTTASPEPSQGVDNTATPEPSLGPETGVMREDFTAMDCAVEMGIGLNLGNTFESFWEDKENSFTGALTIGGNTPQDYETCWGAPVTTKEMIDGIKNAGFKNVRIPVYWGNMMEADGKYEISPAYIERVREVIDYCRSNELYVIVNIHHYDEFIIKNKSREEAVAITEKLWTQIAEAYKDYSDYLVFEGFNENLGSKRENDNFSNNQLFDYTNEMNQTFVDAVRQTGGNNAERILIVSGYNTNIDKTTDKLFVMPNDTVDNKLMVSVHYVDNACYWGKQIGNDYWLNYSKNQCELLKKAFTEKGIPVFIGECTAAYPEDNMASDAIHKYSPDCLEIMLNMIVDYGFVPVIWDVHYEDSFYSRTDCKIVNDDNQAVITGIANRYK